jgi:hypothetical protein
LPTTSSVGRSDVLAFVTDPSEYFGHSWHAMHHVDAQELAQLQLAGLRLRFRDLRDRIAVLAGLADDRGTDQIGVVEDVVPLLFPHTTYKSYPVSLLLQSRFPALTRWLGRLTTHDLSSVDVSGCQTIDEWLDVIEAETPLRPAHSSGTTGTMSFFPRGAVEWARMFSALKCGLFQFSDPLDETDHRDVRFKLIWPLFASGRSAIGRIPEMAMPEILGSPENLHVMRQGRMSADGMFLAARLAQAETRGEVDKLEVPPGLLARRDEFLREQRELQQSTDRFLRNAVRDLAGERVWLTGSWNVLYNMAKAGLEAGQKAVFAPDSLVSTGGGAKGQVVPDEWEDVVKRFVGVDRIQHGYAMTELTGMNRLCEENRYHFEPWIIPFVLDPQTGRPLDGKGEQTGQGAFFDLIAESYWGGTISGDEITIDRQPCECGRTTIHMARRVERYSEKQGGDDKITCAATDEAHNRVLRFLADWGIS